MGPTDPAESLTPVFPDESHMERSADGTEPIRGGSVGFNRILGTFVERSRSDHTPFGRLFLINGMTLFRNVYSEDKSDSQIKAAIEKDIELFALYLGAYRVALSGGNDPSDQTPVLVYFPTYKNIPKDVRLEHSGTKLETFLKRYDAFYVRHKGSMGLLIDAPGVKVESITVGERDLPHRELDHYIIGREDYRPARQSGKVILITHVILDYFICFRIPSVVVWESYTAKFRTKETFGTRLDPSGDIPFNSLMFNLFGDKLFVRSVLDIKAKRFVRKTAHDDRFMMRSQAYMEKQLSALSNVPVALLARHQYI